jgi:enoyl-CoA hydratase
MESSNELVQTEQDGDVTLLRINRPSARNALNAETADAIVAAITGAQTSGAIVLTGADPAFCAGLDLRELGVENLSEFPRSTETAARSGVPIIAAVNGPAVTGGFELALACDFMIASTRARFADTHVRLGVYPGPSMVELPRRVGMAWAREMVLTGNFIESETALRIGLVNHVVAHDDLIPFALDLAHAIAEQDTAMVHAMREDWDATGELPVQQAHLEHRARAQDGPWAGRSGADIAAKRTTVIARAKSQNPPR